ncbi:MAG: hypothetical protein K1X74_17075 [Pirellulales bacterium]|nr:hypothetical protein [Pirellulales bacterium]
MVTFRHRDGAGRRGAALLLSLFVIAVTSVMVLGMLDTQTSEAAAVRNAIDYDRALYLAGAAVHSALAELEIDPSWSKGISSTEFPAGSGNHYSATVDQVDGLIVVTGSGSSGAVTRNLQVTIQTGS